MLSKLTKKYNVLENEVCFVGDDLVDLGLIKLVGFSVAVANASPEIKAAAYYITTKYGGRGAVREVAELILKSQGKWEDIIKFYEA